MYSVRFSAILLSSPPAWYAQRIVKKIELMTFVRTTEQRMVILIIIIILIYECYKKYSRNDHLSRSTCTANRMAFVEMGRNECFTFRRRTQTTVKSENALEYIYSNEKLKFINRMNAAYNLLIRGAVRAQLTIITHKRHWRRCNSICIILLMRLPILIDAYYDKLFAKRNAARQWLNRWNELN